MIATWDKSLFEVENSCTGDRWILLEGCIRSHRMECCVGVIYGQNDRRERSELLQEIKRRVVSINKPCLLMGDFNTVLHPRERSGTFRCVRSMSEFSEWISELNLIDIPLHGIKFTWRRNESKSRLDRALCCQAWLTKFPNLHLTGLKRSISDHNPLLLSLETGNNWGPFPFRCYDAWFLNPNLKGFLMNEWRNIPDTSIHNKLKALKAPLKAWRKEHFDHMDHRISDLETAIHDLDILAESRLLNGMERARLNAANCLLHQWLIKRERVWRQRARTYGFNMKDHNTKFFHASTVYRRKKNEIIQISINGSRVRGVTNLKHEVWNYFLQRFKQQQTPTFEFNLDNHYKLSVDQAQLLERIPSREEVQQAVWACGTDKAPGFDGFSFKFIREMWEMLKDDIYDFVMDFFVNEKSVGRMNITWVSLIPKSGNPTSIEDFRPISMVGALYKII